MKYRITMKPKKGRLERVLTIELNPFVIKKAGTLNCLYKAARKEQAHIHHMDGLLFRARKVEAYNPKTNEWRDVKFPLPPDPCSILDVLENAPPKTPKMRMWPHD